MGFPRLFETCKIGTMELRDRIIMPPVTTNFSREGFVTEKMKNYYAARAQGGVGMIIVEDAIVDSALGRHTANDLYIDHDKYIPGLTQLANCIKARGARAVLNINHGGRRAGKVVNGRLEFTNGKIPVAPSSIAHFEPGYVVPLSVTINEIETITDRFVLAARRAKEAGFEGVSIHCSHAYLINQFLSPSSNRRDDEYGRDFEGRMRFLLGIIEGIQKELGPNYPLLCRISGEEPFEAGLGLEDMKKVALRLEEAGVQAFVLSRGAAAAPAVTSKFVASVAPMRIPRGCMVYLAEGIKQAVRVPVAAVNRINDPILAEQILEEGKADLIGMGRGLIADPELPNKAKEGRLGEIRICIACMWCIDAVLTKNSELVCAVNAEVGRERIFDLSEVEKPKKVLVVGGGPAGMEAARVAAIRGHEVHLYESGSRLGGQLLVSSKPPGKEEVDNFAKYLEGEVKRLGVDVKTGTPLAPADIEKLSPDMVIMATGAKPLRPSMPGIDQKNVVTALDVLQGVKDATGNVVVLGGGQVGAEVAEYLAAKERNVTIIEMLDQIAIDLPSSIRVLLLLSLKENGVKTITEAKAEKITQTGVIVNKEGKELLIPADSVVLALGVEADRSLECKVGDQRVLWVGDCVKPRKILEAVQEGFEAGASV